MASLGDLAIDLVAGSIGRLDDLRRLAQSLSEQTHRNHKLIVVEQADPAGARAVLSEFPQLRWEVVECERGLSRARNRGLAECTADIVGFPDDDCWYRFDTLAHVVERFVGDPTLDMLVGTVVTPSGAPYVKTPNAPLVLDRTTIWRVGLSAASFFRATAVNRIGSFDPTLGVGSGTPYQSGEETDFFLRGISAGLYGEFDPQLVINHPAMADAGKGISPDIGRGYGMGMGMVLRRHSYHWTSALTRSVRPLLGAAVAAGKGESGLARFRLAVASGRFSGYFKSPPDTADIPLA
jgi:hypothetical protein